LLAGGDAIQSSDGIGGIVDISQGLKVSAVGSKRDLAITEQVSHTLSHVHPPHDFLTLARDLFANGKSLRFVDDHLQPEDRAGLAVQLQLVLFYTMFDPGSRNALEGEIAAATDDVSFEVGSDLSSKFRI